jgi:hypothetical protein
LEGAAPSALTGLQKYKKINLPARFFLFFWNDFGLLAEILNKTLKVR